MAQNMGNVSSPVFVEEQSFNQLWVKVLLGTIMALALVFVVYSSYVQLYLGLAFGNKPMSNIALIIFNAIFLGLGVGALFLWNRVKLVVMLDSENMYIHFWPFVNKTILIDDIVSFKAKTYRPIRDYGGWGMRYSLKEKHWAYNVSGNRGVLFEFKDGKKLLIGSQYPSKLVVALTKLKVPPQTQSEKTT